MLIDINLLESDTTIRKLILDSIADHIDAALVKCLAPIKANMEPIVLDAIRNQPEYTSLISGQLRYEFGIPDTNKINQILLEIFNTIRVTKKNTSFNNSSITGGLMIDLLNNEDLIKLTESSSAFVVDENKGYSLPWLRWLLLEGARPIVKKYEVKIGPNTFSRTGMAVMVDSDKSWSVPNAFVGTVTNNWITRGIESIDEQIIENLIQNTLEKYI